MPARGEGTAASAVAPEARSSASGMRGYASPLMPLVRGGHVAAIAVTWMKRPGACL